MSDPQPTEPGTPALVGSNWVLPTLDDLSNAQVRLHVSIAVAPDEELTGSDVGVRLTADSTELSQTQGPDPASPLPVIESRGSTAFAQYTFDNPNNLSPSSLTVSLRGQTAEFPLGATGTV